MDLEKNNLINLAINQIKELVAKQFYKEAEYLCKEVLKLEPNKEALFQYGLIFINTSKYKEAARFFELCLRIEPNDANSLYFLGLLENINNPDNYLKALDCLQNAISIDPNFNEPKWLASIICLKNCDFENGWKYFSYKMHASNFSHGCFNTAEYDGYEKVKTLLIVGEIEDAKFSFQGFGDNILFSRFIPEIAKNGIKILFKPKKGLENLFKYCSKDLNCEVIGSLENIQYDFWVHLSSLPKILNININNMPSKHSYLKSLPINANMDLDKNRINIGIVWRGYSHKTLQLSDLEILFGNTNFKFFSLQIDGKDEIESSGYNINDCSPMIDNWSDTANLINQLDIIISIDTAISHLSCALGRKTIILLPENYYWIWGVFDNDESKSYWYSNAHLIRQKSNTWKDIGYKILKTLNSFETTCSQRTNCD